jgi:UDP-N-acetylmuramoyl-tripeptide--D-alanyl-D-alanine ligase
MKKNPSAKSAQLKLLEKIVRFLAILILKKYNPQIVGITGSVGKTSSKEAIFTVLSGHYRVRKNEKNYNNEIGLPLTIIGSESGGASILRWIGVFLKAFGILLLPFEYPEVLILEMGADRPGDIKYLTEFIRCKVAVITEISGSHLEYFATLDRVAEEKWSLVESLGSGCFAAINIDNQIIAKIKDQTKNKEVKFLTFGFSEAADFQAKEVFYNYTNSNGSEKKEIHGLSFKLNNGGTTIPVRLNNILAQHNIYAALAGVAVGVAFKLNLVEIAEALENFSMPAGRMNPLGGIKNTFIIDDTYNSSPVSALAALEVLKNITTPRKIAVMGDMLELGDNTENGHRDLAKKFLEVKGDIFFAVGKRMQFAAEELQKRNISPDRLFIFPDPITAGRKLQEIMKEGDLILVKGSQGMRMEKIVEEVMAKPDQAEFYLCRQGKTWKSKPWKEI